MTGKEKCKILRQIRREIAQANHIPYPPDECDYEGEDCPGSCPRCEQEMDYLEMCLINKRRAGQDVHIHHFSDNSLLFRLVHETEENPLELPVLARAHWNPAPETFLRLSRASIVTVGDLVRISPTVLSEKYRIDNRELDHMEEMLRRMGLAWGRRRSRYEDIRGMMRRPRD